MSEIDHWAEAPPETEAPADTPVACLTPDRATSSPGLAPRCGGPIGKRESWLAATPASARAARSLVREAAAEVGLDGEQSWDLMLAATEAVANAVQHGQPWPNGCVLFATEPCPRGLRVEVRDQGSFDSHLEPASLDATSGRGLRLIATLTDRFEITTKADTGTTVRFEKHTKHEAPRSNGNGAHTTHPTTNGQARPTHRSIASRATADAPTKRGLCLVESPGGDNCSEWPSTPLT
jgi:anti-sigma regulatory factor (Ser/Thr protein kinase)